MPHDSTHSTDQGVASLVQGIVADAEKLVRQQFELFRQEIREEVDHAKSAAAAGGAGAGMMVLGGVLGAHMLVHGVRDSTKLPLWACYGLVGGAIGGAGLALLGRARRQVGELGLPRKSSEALRENVEWLKQQTNRGQ